MKWRREQVDGGGEKGGLARPDQDSEETAAISKPWRRLAMATYGQEGGLAMLECLDVSSLFFLRPGRIFSRLGVAIYAAVDPSGLVPDAVADPAQCARVVQQ